MAPANPFRLLPGNALERPAGFLRSVSKPGQQLSHREDQDWYEAGQSMVEMALTLPILLALIFCLMELCLIFYTYNIISESAREGTRYAMFHGATCQTAANTSCTLTAQQVDTYVSGLGWPNLGGGTMTPVTSFPDLNEAVGSRVRIKITYSFPISMPYVPTSSISMSSTSEMRIVQ